MIEEMGTGSHARPLLTIAIPTYNRARYLRELLSVLFDQLVTETLVELIVSDNASPDETPAVVEEYQMRGLRLRSIRNETNIGADANFLQCFEQARGKYFWLFGDDDIIVPGGVAKILSLLALEEFAIAYISPYEFRVDFLAERSSDRFGRFAEIIPGGLQLVQLAGPMITFISALIVNKDQFPATAHKALPGLIGTNLIQLGWVCPMLTSNLKSLFVWERLVAGRGGNCAGWGPCQVFGVNLKQVAEATLGNRADIAETICNRTLQNWFPGTILDIRRGSATELKQENMRELLERIYRRNWRYWLYVFPVIGLPLIPAQMWRSCLLLATRPMRIFSTVLRSFILRKNFLSNPPLVRKLT